MAAHENNFLPLNDAIALNRQFGRGYPFYQDVNQLNFIMMQPVVYTDPSAPTTLLDGFEFLFYDNKRIRFDTILYGSSTFATVDLWLAYLNSIGACPMTKYVNYIKIGKRSLGQTVSAILVNDEKVVRRVYNAQANTTDLWVDYGNTIRRTILTLQGDQTIAGGYYYA